MDLPKLDGTPEEIAAALEVQYKPIWTFINQKGYTAGYAVGTGEYKNAAKTGIWNLAVTEAETLKAQITGLDAKIKTLSEANPDFAKEKIKYELALQGLQEKLDEATGGREKDLTDFTAQLQAKDTTIFDDNFARTLTELDVEPIYVDVARRDAAYTSRRTMNGDGTFKVFQVDGKTPFQAEDGKKPFQQLAESYLQGIPKKFIADRRPQGPGFDYNRGTPASGTMHISEFLKMTPKAQGKYIDGGGRPVN